ncbi:hypothetical protein [Pedobacter sp. Leaf132]|uniref:hypothetical protein n=1 Tax=Pedobacter sp. Leaf132 TaxID=2876557 RepID=UPI001E560960|nr:hypothetical protein [Pedobacter sp. Leaf132]
MDNKRSEKSEKEIVKDLGEVGKNADKQYDAEELDETIGDLGEQIKGSDADSDQSLGNDVKETKKQEQVKGSDAGKG